MAAPSYTSSFSTGMLLTEGNSATCSLELSGRSIGRGSVYRWYSPKVFSWKPSAKPSAIMALAIMGAPPRP